MTPALWLLLAGCGTLTQQAGRAPLSVASVAMEANSGMIVRPAEVRWRVGGPMTSNLSLNLGDLAPDMGPSAVWYGGPGPDRGLPAQVRLAAARAVAASDADGALVTHWLIEESLDRTPAWKVQVFGRFLHLDVVGVVDGERFDTLEGLPDRLDLLLGDATAPAPAAQPVAAPEPPPKPTPRPVPPPPPAPVPAPAPEAPPEPGTWGE